GGIPPASQTNIASQHTASNTRSRSVCFVVIVYSIKKGGFCPPFYISKPVLACRATRRSEAIFPSSTSASCSDASPYTFGVTAPGNNCTINSRVCVTPQGSLYI